MEKKRGTSAGQKPMEEKRRTSAGQMQTKTKRWLKYFCLFALTLVISLSAAGTKQAQAETTSGSCGDSAKYEYDSSTGTLTISGSDAVAAPSAWDDISGSVKKLVVGDKITDIGTYTGWSALTTVTLGAKVKTINDRAFRDCTSLTTVDMGDSAVTSIGAYAFGWCEKLKKVTLSKKLTKISYGAFYSCSKLASISLPSSLTTIGSGAFSGSGLKKVTIPKNVTSIVSSSFDNCKNLTKIAVSSGNSKYSAKDGVLYNKGKTKLITYPAGKSSTSFTVPATVTSISGYAFYGASNLKSISLNKVKKIGDCAFGASGLKKITIPKSVTSISSRTFEDCMSLTKIAVSSDNTKYSAKDGVLYNKAKTNLIVYPVLKSDTSFTTPSTVKKISADAFRYNDYLKSVTISSKVTEIGQQAFWNCLSLKTVTIGSGVKTIGYGAFAYCFALTTVKFKGSAPSVAAGYEEYGGYVFSGVTATIKYPSSKKSSWTKTYRSQLNAGAKANTSGGGKLTFKSY